jgi:hypothetical protein
MSGTDPGTPFPTSRSVLLFPPSGRRRPGARLSPALFVSGKPKIKKVYKEKGSIILESINPAFKPEKIKSSHIRILGVAKGVIHQF